MEARGASTGWRDAEPMVTRFPAESSRAHTRARLPSLCGGESCEQGSLEERMHPPLVLAWTTASSSKAAVVNSNSLWKTGISRLLGAAEPAELHILR